MWRSLLAAVCSGALICGLVGCAEEETKAPKKPAPTEVEEVEKDVKESDKTKTDIEKAKEEGKKKLDEAKKKVSKIVEDEDEK